jgi:hypothetical protein
MPVSETEINVFLIYRIEYERKSAPTIVCAYEGIETARLRVSELNAQRSQSDSFLFGFHLDETPVRVFRDFV